jgi:hypothetical protein
MLDAVAVFVPIRHIWLMGEYAGGSTGCAVKPCR